MPMWVDKLVRTWFFVMLFYPVCRALPYVLPLVFLYYVTYIDGSEQKHARMMGAVRRSIVWKKIAGYFMMTQIVRTSKLETNRQYIFDVHPHGILPFGTMAALLTEALEKDVWQGIKMRVLAASFCFYVPIYRDMILAGGVVDAARYNAKRLLKEGYSLMLVPGGATEALHTTPDQDVVFLKSRKGFVRLALENGAWLVPCYSFGESETYRQMKGGPVVDFMKKHWQRIFGISLPLITNIIPRKVKITPVIGTPIPVDKVEKPTEKQVQDLLDKYIVALQQLYKDNMKYNNTPGKQALKVI